jgi:hypothetical protein
LAGSRRFGGFTPVHLLALVAIAEVGVYRVLVGDLTVVVQPNQPPPPPAPDSHVVVGWIGVFLHYFVGALAIGLLVMRAIRAGKVEPGVPPASRGREILIGSAAAVIAALGAVGLMIGEDATTAFLLETAFCATALIAFGVWLPQVHWKKPGAIGPGAVIGLGFLIAPFVIHYYGVLGGKWLWPDEAADPTGRIGGVTRTGISALCAAAIVSPYCFGPRPFTRSVVRIAPVAVAMAVAGVLAVLARRYYVDAVEVVKHATGLKLDPEHPERDTALYILSFATLCWTLTSCAIADAAPRRKIGLGLALVVLGGYHDVVWPAYYAMIALGLITIVDAIPGLAEAERLDPRIAPTTPAIDDRVWQEWVTALVAALRGAGHTINALTARGEDDHMTTVVTGDLAGRSFRLRVDRIAGAVLVIDTRFGREMGDDTPATFTVATKREGMGMRDAHPDPPASGTRLELGDDGFDARFRSRGSRAALTGALDEGVRARLTATMDGWLAAWGGASLRHRVYPGRGAPIDQPIPLSDLALRRAGPDAVDRLVAMIGLLAEIAKKVVPEREPDPEGLS